MKRPLAYITAAWSGEHEKDGRRAIAALCMRRAFPRFAPSSIFP